MSGPLSRKKTIGTECGEPGEELDTDISGAAPNQTVISADASREDDADAARAKLHELFSRVHCIVWRDVVLVATVCHVDCLRKGLMRKQRGERSDVWIRVAIRLAACVVEEVQRRLILVSVWGLSGSYMTALTST